MTGTPYTDEQIEAIAEKVFEHMANGKGIKVALRLAEGPHPATWFRWIAKKDELRARYDEAIETSSEYWAEQCGDAAEQLLSGRSKIDPHAVNAAMKAIQTRQQIVNMGIEKRGKPRDAKLTGEDKFPVTLKINRPEAG